MRSNVLTGNQNIQRLYKILPDLSNRADLAQEVWLSIYRSIHQLEDPAKFRGWLKQITTNRCYDELRKRQRRGKSISLDAPLQLDNGPVDWELPCQRTNPTELLERQESYKHVQDAISNLPIIFRNVLILRDVQDLPYETIADEMGISLGTVKSRIARARQRLQSNLEPYLHS